MAEKQYTYNNESFSGSDMVATILLPRANSEKKDVYNIGELQTISYSIHMDRQPVRNVGNINVKDYVKGPRTIAGSLVFAVFDKHFANKIMKDIGNTFNPGYAFMIDEIPPFDIVMSMANEYGNASRLVIYGVRLVNEGQVMSVNDVYTENTYQFVATDLEYLTDEETYSSGKKGKDGLYKVTSKNNEINPLMSELSSISIVKNEQDQPVELSYKVIDNERLKTKGLVEFSLYPITRTGQIVIRSAGKEINIDVADSINKNNKIAVQLDKGEYEAIWSDSVSKSNTVNFKIVREVVLINEQLPAPIIEFVSDNVIDIYTNVSHHNKVSYKDKDGNIFKVKMSAKKARLDQLSPSSAYIISTCTDSELEYSKEIKVETLAYGHDNYSDFTDYLRYNRRTLDNSNLDIYVQVIDKSKSFAFNTNKPIEINDSFNEAYKYYQERVKSLDTNDFTGIFEYEDELNRLKELESAAREIVQISTQIVNDKIYGYNYDTKVVDPPREVDVMTHTTGFVIGENINYLDFFREYPKVRQFDKTIRKIDFKAYEDNRVALFNGKAGTKYSVYAVNSNGFKSPRVDFYISDNNSKIDRIEANETEQLGINYELEKVKDLNYHKLNFELNEIEMTRVITEISKNSQIKSISTPRITQITDTNIYVEIDDFKEILEANEYKVVISLVDSALKNIARYKVEASSNVEFSIYKHGIRPGYNYIIWVEDSNELQISNAISIKFENENISDIEREHEISNYFLNEIADLIKEDLTNKFLISEKLISIINRISNDLATTKSNIFDLILEEVMEDAGSINNLYEVLFSIIKSYHEYNYDINESFFTIDPIYNPNKQEVIISEDVNIKRWDILKDGLYKTNSNVKNGEVIKINNENAYTVLSFLNKNLSSRSGFVVINNFNKSCKAYKMKIREGEN